MPKRPSTKQSKASVRLSASQRAAFQKFVWSFYGRNGRQFPWRETTDPYRIFVSEIMLQQTQTDRVVPKYLAFVERFPTWQSLAKSSLSTVLKMWSGLGYNRRALALLRAAQCIGGERGGILPCDLNELKKLPGVGEYTAQALRAFVFNLPSCCIETNIRAVFIDRFFPATARPTDEEIRTLILGTLPQENFREWYYALMDLGSSLKKRKRAVSQRSAHYTRQSPFAGSRRQIRGALLKALVTTSQSKLSLAAHVAKKYDRTRDEVLEVLGDLARDQLVLVKGTTVCLP